MTTTFTEQADIETGFSEVFSDRIVPRLDELEQKRQAILSVAKRHATIALAVGVVFGLWFTWAGEGSGGIGGLIAGFLLPVAFGGVAAFLLWKRQAAKWRGSAAETIMPVICDFIGDMTYDHEALRGFPLERIQKLGVIRPFGEAKTTDRLEGTYRDTPFELVQAKLSSNSRRRDDDGAKTQFKGLLMRIGVPEPISDRILIARDFHGPGNKLAEMFGGGTGRRLPKVDTGHELFEQYFEVYSSNPSVAREILAPGFLDSFVKIAEAESGRHGPEGLEAGFHEESFFMALKRDDEFLQMGALTSPADEIEDELHGVFEDISTVRRIIDRLHGDHPA
ncbi:DUF3137 domain-containing protein [Aquicoccus sp. SCR17]|nr:DUF3137 domain-containing protein [Carideicomes alvinocaridis]